MSVVRKLLLVGIAAQFVFMAGPVRAQASWPLKVEDPLLAALIEEALSRNPDLGATREAAAAAEQRPPQARSLPNPTVTVGYQNDGWSPSLGSMSDSNLALMASQQLPYPGKRQLRGDIASREAGQVRQEAARAGRSIAAAVKKNYYGLLLARELLDVIHDHGEIWRQIEGVTRARYAVGLGTQQDVLRAQVEVTRIEQRLADQEGEAEIRLAELNRLLNRAPITPLETTARLKLRPAARALEELVEWTSAVSPELKAADLDIERASLSVTLARKEFKPDFSVQTTYMNRGGLAPMWQAGIGISIPAYRNRLRAGVAEAEAQLLSSRSMAESIRLRLRFQTQQRLIQLKTTERVATLYGEGIVPQDRMSVEAALANYETGKVPFITVLEALTTFHDDHSTHLRLLATHEQTLASLEEASLAPGSGSGEPRMADSIGGPSRSGSNSMGNR